MWYEADDELRQQAISLLGEEENKLGDSDDEEPQPYTDLSEREKKMATREDFQEILDKIVEDADKLAFRDDIDALDENSHSRTVLGDLFHFMDSCPRIMNINHSSLEH